MRHPIHRVISFEPVAPYTLRIGFEDGTSQVIDFRPMLKGEVFGALRDPDIFRQVQIDPEIHTLVWPNGADFDPATLYDWPRVGKRMEELAQKWAGSSAA
jgi:Protein of unknown function (DUF2442)